MSTSHRTRSQPYIPTRTCYSNRMEKDTKMVGEEEGLWHERDNSNCEDPKEGVNSNSVDPQDNVNANVKGINLLNAIVALYNLWIQW